MRIVTGYCPVTNGNRRQRCCRSSTRMVMPQFHGMNCDKGNHSVEHLRGVLAEASVDVRVAPLLCKWKHRRSIWVNRESRGMGDWIWQKRRRRSRWRWRWKNRPCTWFAEARHLEVGRSGPLTFPENNRGICTAEAEGIRHAVVKGCVTGRAHEIECDRGIGRFNLHIRR